MAVTEVNVSPGGGVSLREHVELMMEARDRTIEVQIRGLAEVVRGAQEQGSREHSEVRQDIAGMRGDLTTLRSDVTALQTTDSARANLRAGDLAKIGALAGFIGAVAVFLPH